MNVTTWVCFWLAVIGIASVVNAHKPPIEIHVPDKNVTHEVINAVIMGFLQEKAKEHKYDGLAWIYEAVIEDWKKAGKDEPESDDNT